MCLTFNYLTYFSVHLYSLENEAAMHLFYKETAMSNLVLVANQHRHLSRPSHYIVYRGLDSRNRVRKYKCVSLNCANVLLRRLLNVRLVKNM